MKRLAKVMFLSSIVSYLYAGNTYYNQSANDNGYKSNSGNTYQYDLSNPSDRIGYSVDVGAQQRDKYDSMYNNYDQHIQKDQRDGQYGGGVYDDN